MSGCHTAAPAPAGFGGGFALLIVLFILLIIIGASFYGGWGY
ncbi:YjcZ family sporulation protein [Amphibacillus cookii]|nr:YjcZ family sporulation protein [Amphibacillus cookii]MBM7539820.1 uncharacterized protein (TIGR01732 family) [Amphibacillus cookii]